NVSLDGVIQDPAGDEGFRVGGWVGRITDREEVAKVTLDEALGTEALLLGRRTYEWFAARWPSRSGELADRLNSLPKYVVSSTLQDPDWNDSAAPACDSVPKKIGCPPAAGGIRENASTAGPLPGPALWSARKRDVVGVVLLGLSVLRGRITHVVPSNRRLPRGHPRSSPSPRRSTGRAGAVPAGSRVRPWRR